MTRCHELRKRPLDAFTVEDLRIMIAQASGETTAGAFAIIEEEDPLDTPLRVHANEDELFYVIEGEHVFRVGVACPPAIPTRETIRA